MKKIMFNDEYCLTAAVLAEIKKQTRRIIPQSIVDELYYAGFYGDFTDNLKQIIIKNKSRYKVGEKVAVAQSYFDIKTSANSYRPPFWKGYKDWHKYLESLPTNGGGCYNKMFVRAELMPHKIEITNIRVERLQDISNEDCLAEGITTKIEGKFEVGNGYGWNTTIERLKRDTFLTPRKAYAALIDAISGKGTWERNPYCFCYTFKLID